MDILVTNNPLVKVQYCSHSRLNVEFMDTRLLGVLTHVRDCIHKGHKLLTHPLSGSIKPNESPYKSVLLKSTSGNTDTESVMIIEECILTAQKFPHKNILDKYLHDLQTVDFTLIKSALDSH